MCCFFFISFSIFISVCVCVSLLYMNQRAKNESDLLWITFYFWNANLELCCVLHDAKFHLIVHFSFENLLSFLFLLTISVKIQLIIINELIWSVILWFHFVTKCCLRYVWICWFWCCCFGLVGFGLLVCFWWKNGKFMSIVKMKRLSMYLMHLTGLNPILSQNKYVTTHTNAIEHILTCADLCLYLFLKENKKQHYCVRAHNPTTQLLTHTLIHNNLS